MFHTFGGPLSLFALPSYIRSFKSILSPLSKPQCRRGRKRFPVVAGGGVDTPYPSVSLQKNKVRKAPFLKQIMEAFSKSHQLATTPGVSRVVHMPGLPPEFPTSILEGLQVSSDHSSAWHRRRLSPHHLSRLPFFYYTYQPFRKAILRTTLTNLFSFHLLQCNLVIHVFSLLGLCFRSTWVLHDPSKSTSTGSLGLRFRGGPSTRSLSRALRPDSDSAPGEVQTAADSEASTGSEAKQFKERYLFFFTFCSGESLVKQ